ncbi:Short-chain alcohol dehydrogenase, partial [Pyrenophora tritici-repentis]
IGLAIAHHLLAASHKVVLISRTTAPLSALESQYGSSQVSLLAGNMADATLARRAVEAAVAVLNHLAATLSVEEPSITTISIRPGVVDTEMQREIREVHASSMSAKDREKFSGLKENGGLLRPEQPGHVIARLAVAEGEAIQGFSGKFLSWNDEVLGAFQG